MNLSEMKTGELERMAEEIQEELQVREMDRKMLQSEMDFWRKEGMQEKGAA